jgi:RNA-directed DNA polymerase
MDSPGTYALDALWVGIVRKRVNWILDLDICSFFDRLQHNWLIRFVEHRVGDGRIVRLIQKWLKAGGWSKGSGPRRRKGIRKGR